VSTPDREHLRDLASLHALGVLSPAERDELAAAMTGDAELAAEVRALEDTAGALGGVVPQVDPPARLRARVRGSRSARSGATRRAAPLELRRSSSRKSRCHVGSQCSEPDRPP